jgi:hypothetical protein
MAVGEALLARVQGLFACLHEALCSGAVGAGGVAMLRLISLVERGLLLGTEAP